MNNQSRRSPLYAFLTFSFVSFVALLQPVNSLSATPPRSFFGDVDVIRNERTFPSKIYYDYDISRQAINYTITDGSYMKELYHYDRNQQFQMCSSANQCQNIVWEQDMFKFFLPEDGSATQVSNSVLVGGVECEQYSLSQPGSWESQLWFNKISGYIVKAILTKDSVQEEYHFANDLSASIPDLSIFTPGNNCGSITCFVKLDLVLVLDDSDSIDQPGWNSAIAFAKEVRHLHIW